MGGRPPTRAWGGRGAGRKAANTAAREEKIPFGRYRKKGGHDHHQKGTPIPPNCD